MDAGLCNIAGIVLLELTEAQLESILAVSVSMNNEACTRTHIRSRAYKHKQANQSQSRHVCDCVCIHVIARGSTCMCVSVCLKMALTGLHRTCLQRGSYIDIFACAYHSRLAASQKAKRSQKPWNYLSCGSTLLRSVFVLSF